MGYNNRNFNQNCTKKNEKNPRKEIKELQKNHHRTSWKDTKIRKNKNIERTYYRKI